MPITFKDKWNSLSLKRLTKDDGAKNIFYFWRAKTRFHADAPGTLQSLGALPRQDRPVPKRDEPIYGAGTPAQISNSISAALRPDGSFDRQKSRLTTSMVRKFNRGLSSPKHFDVPSNQLDRMMTDIQIDRLRIGDRHMLNSASAVDIRRALFAAHSRFNSNPQVAALLSRAIAMDGKPVEVTQGVHQSNDPHFDVLMPGEAQQYHVNVAYGEKPLRIISISFMNPVGSATRTTTVEPDS